MPIKLFKKEDAIERKVADTYSVFNFLTAADSEKLSVAVGVAKNHNESTKTSSERAYYVLEGEIIINDDIIGEAGDVVLIEGNTEYKFKGNFKAVIINSPPFRKKNESVKII